MKSKIKFRNPEDHNEEVLLELEKEMKLRNEPPKEKKRRPSDLIDSFTAGKFVYF